MSLQGFTQTTYRGMPRRLWKKKASTISYTGPNVCLGDGKNCRGNMVFIGGDPEVVFEIGWKVYPTS
jgi:hypothetical protein